MNTKQQLVSKLVSGSKQTWEVVCEAFALYASTHDATEVFQLQLSTDITKDDWNFAVKQSGGVGFSAAATKFVLELGKVGKVRYITESHVKRAKMVLGQVEFWGKELGQAHRYFIITTKPTASKKKAHKGMLDHTVVFRTLRHKSFSGDKLLITHDIECGVANLCDVNNRNNPSNTTTNKANSIMMWGSDGKSINVTKTFNDARTAIDTYSTANDDTAGNKAQTKAREKLDVAIVQYRAVIKKAIEDHNALIDNCQALRSDKVTMPSELS